MSSPLRLRRLHPDSTILANTSSVDYWEKQPTYLIVQSLRRGQDEPLLVKKDGTIMQGNTRVYILDKRGYDIDSLPYELYRPTGDEDFYDL